MPFGMPKGGRLFVSRFRLTMKPSNLVGFLIVQAGGGSGAAAELGSNFVVGGTAERLAGGEDPSDIVTGGR
ncbi:hypothetical protein GCM10022284_68970 [Streptomyces hundungensis]